MSDYIKVPKKAISSMLALIEEVNPQSQNVLTILYAALAKDIIRMYEEQT